jgi:hypothetical protein
LEPRQFAHGLPVVPGRQEIEHPPAERAGLEYASIEQDRRGRQEGLRPRPSADQRGQGFAGLHVREAAGEKPGEMLADDWIRGVGEAEFLQTDAPTLLRQVGDIGSRKEAVDRDLLEGRPVELRRHGSGEQAGAA